VALVRTEVSEERDASIIKGTRINVLQSLLSSNFVPSSCVRSTQKMEVTLSFETLRSYKSHTA
jgi:hypothetical protein